MSLSQTYGDSVEQIPVRYYHVTIHVRIYVKLCQSGFLCFVVVVVVVVGGGGGDGGFCNHEINSLLRSIIVFESYWSTQCLSQGNDFLYLHLTQ